MLIPEARAKKQAAVRTIVNTLGAPRMLRPWSWRELSTAAAFVLSGNKDLIKGCSTEA